VKKLYLGSTHGEKLIGQYGIQSDTCLGGYETGIA